MCATNIIVDVTDREIKRIILVLAGRNADGRLVTAENDWTKRGAMSAWITGDFVLRRV